MEKLIALSVVVFASYEAFAGEQINNGLVAPTPLPSASYFRYVGRSGILADVGGGIEYRFNPNFGIFADARYNFAENPLNEFITTRVGVQYALPSFGQKSIDEETPPNNKIPIIETENEGEHQNWAIHFDAVEVIQGQPGFHSPYEGPQSLFPNDDFRQTSDVDLFFVFRNISSSTALCTSA